MSSALSLVVILVVVGDANDPVNVAMKRAAEESLGPGASVSLESVARPLDDAEAIALEASRHADAIAAITWGDQDRRRARLHLHVRSSWRWIDREMGFAASDVAPEEGRTLGFTVASMLPERERPPASSASIAPPSSGMFGASPGRDRSTPDGSERPPRDWYGAVDVAFLAAGSIDGYGGGVGGGLGVEKYIGPHLSLRLEAAARLSEVRNAQATSFMLTAGGGIAWRSTIAMNAQRFGLGARLDALALRQSMTHLDDDDTSPAHAARWLPAADAVFEGSWLFTEGASFVVGLGGEVAFGTTTIFSKRTQVGTLSPFHVLFESGFRTRF